VPLLAGWPRDLRFVLALHEASVVGMATGWAIASGEPAFVLLHTTAGLGNGVAALATARVNRAPLVVLVGQQDRRHLAAEPFLAGKLEGLVARFRDHTMRIFAKHGIKSVAYWTALDEPVKSSTLIYMLEHPSRDAATANWKNFQEDPEWKSVKEKSEANGKLVEKIDSTFLTLTDFSPRLG